MEMSPAQSARSRTAYEKIIAALNEAQLPGEMKFALVGTIFTQVFEAVQGDAEFKHRLVDNFAETTHQLIDEQ